MTTEDTRRRFEANMKRHGHKCEMYRGQYVGHFESAAWVGWRSAIADSMKPRQMDSVPKDGRLLILDFPDCADYVTARWHTDESNDDSHWSCGRGYRWGNLCQEADEPTGWLPYPTKETP